MNDAKTTDTFEARLRHVPADKRMPIINVADTAYLAISWLHERGLSFTAADVLRMTEMILAEQKAEESPDG
jgi:hypothetical protein